MNTGGPAYPQHGWSNDPKVLERMKTQGGMTLLDWFAGQEEIGDEDMGWSICEHYAGPRPTGDWKTNPVEWHEWQARWRAGIKYMRAAAMLAEKARREAVVKESSTPDHSGEANKMVGDHFRGVTKMTELEAQNRELVEFAERIAAFPLEDFGWEKRSDSQPLHGWNDYTLYVSDIKRARNLAAKAKGVA